MTIVEDKRKAGDIEIDFSAASPNISTEAILRVTSEEQIFKHYLGDNFRVKAPICSPLRNDFTPSFSVYPTSSGNWRWNDFATGEGGDCFELVQKLLGVDFKTALKVVYRDLIAVRKTRSYPSDEDIRQESVLRNGASTISLSSFLEERADRYDTRITVDKQPYSPIDVNYWDGRYGITIPTLSKYGVYPVKRAWINGNPIPWEYKSHNPLYAFEFFDVQMTQFRYKLYRPLELIKGDRWRSNCFSIDIMGYKQLPKGGNLLIITKAMKDVMFLAESCFNAIAPQSETQDISEQRMKELKERFKDIVVLFDYDEKGISAATKFAKKHNVNIVFTQDKEHKDISDYAQTHRKSNAIGMLLDRLRFSFGNTLNFEYATTKW